MSAYAGRLPSLTTHSRQPNTFPLSPHRHNLSQPMPPHPSPHQKKPHSQKSAASLRGQEGRSFSPRVENAFDKMCVTGCEIPGSGEGDVAGYVNWIRTRYFAVWGVQIIGMIFYSRATEGRRPSQLRVLPLLEPSTAYQAELISKKRKTIFSSQFL